MATNSSHNTINRLLGGRFKFESKNYPNEFLRHKNGKLQREKQENSQLYQLDTSFDVVPGLYGIGISFRSVNYPDHFIRHCNDECSIAKSEDTELFTKDASWIPREGIADPKGVSFESVNYPGEFMRHSNARICKDRHTTEVFSDDATWYPRLLKPPKVIGEWKLVYANDNAAASGQFTDSAEVGTDFIENQLTNFAFSWKSILQRSLGANVPVLEGFPSVSSSVKDVFEFGMNGSVAHLDPSTWNIAVTKKPETYTISLKAGEPVYLWKWHIAAMTSDSTYMVAKTNIYRETKSHQSPDRQTE